jgi:GNAT superfamily N-acetyltransferase
MEIHMEDPPPGPEVPEGIQLRPFHREQEGKALIEAIQEAFQDNWGYVERPFELEYERWMYVLDHDDERAAQYWFVAVEGPEIVGFLLPRLQLSQDPEKAWIYIVGVRRPWRRRGIALALLRRTFSELYQNGKRKIGLEVDTQNPTGATQLYEKAGMHVLWREDFFEKELRTGLE